MTTTDWRRSRPSLLLLAAGLLWLAACGRSGLLDHATSPATGGNGGAAPVGGNGGSGGDAGKTSDDASPDRGADLLGPDRPDVGVDRPPDVAADASPDRPADASLDRAVDVGPDRGIDRPVDYALDAASGLDLGRADARPDGRPSDLSLDATGQLKLVAGQLGAPGSRDGIGDAAGFLEPSGVTTDGMGTLFVVDSGSCTIRKLTIASREVTTLAGSTGNCGSDDGVGASARFRNPNAIAYDGAGNLFVGDGENYTIRKVVIATGVVTTLAGAAGVAGSADGKGGNARFSWPAAVACDGAGNLFVADAGNATLRKVEIATAEVTTLAGAVGSSGHVDGVGAAARFDGSIALACDKAGKVFVGDRGSGTIRQVVAATGAVTTLAGIPYGWTSTDGARTLDVITWMSDLTYDGAGNLIVANPGGHDIRQVVIATGVVTELASPADDVGGICPWDDPGADTGGIHPPGMFDVVSDGAGKLYISVAGNNTICEIVVATKTVTKLAGTGPGYGRANGGGSAARFASPRGLASDGAGNLFVADRFNQTVRMIGIATAEVTTLAGWAGNRWWPPRDDGVDGPAVFGDPTAVASDRMGHLFVADTADSTLRQILVDTGVVSTLAGSHGMSGDQDGTGVDARFGRPTSLAYDGAGNLFVAEEGVSNIRKVDTATGAVTTLALSAPRLGSSDGSVTAAGLNPAGLACDGTGNLFVADAVNCTIYKVELATSMLTTLAGLPGNCGFANGTGEAARFLGPADMVSDGAGNLYVSDPPNHAVRKVALATGTVTTVVGSPDSLFVVLGPLPAKLNWPAGLAFVPGAGLYIADAEENAILLAQF